MQAGRPTPAEANVIPGGPFPGRAEITSQQLQRLQTLLAALGQSNPFYRQKLKQAPVGQSLQTLDEFARFPFTTKTELALDQAEHPPYGTDLTYPLERYTRYHQTSGTTGVPLRWLDTPESWASLVDCWIEIFRAAGVSSHDRILFAFSFGPFIGFWLAFDAGTKLGALCLPAGSLSSAARLRLLFDARATVLCCTPTYALRLAEVAREEKIDLAQTCLRRIVVAGEPGGSIPATRERLHSLWPGATIFDHHGMTETGPVTFECPRRPGYLHVLESAFLPEVINPTTGQRVDPGQAGELVLTTLTRTASPLLRYRTGDLVRFEPTHGKACACGRHEATLEGGILGRVDDMVIVRGVNVYPTAVEQLLRACPGIAEYQVRVRHTGSLTELTLTIEPDPDCPDAPELIRRVHTSFDQALALSVPVQLARPGSLPRPEMKAKRWLVEKQGAGSREHGAASREQGARSSEPGAGSGHKLS